MGVKKDEEVREQEGKKAEATKVEEKKSEGKNGIVKQMENMSMSSTNSGYESEINEGARRKSRLITGVSIH